MASAMDPEREQAERIRAGRLSLVAGLAIFAGKDLEILARDRLAGRGRIAAHKDLGIHRAFAVDERHAPGRGSGRECPVLRQLTAETAHRLLVACVKKTIELCRFKSDRGFLPHQQLPQTVLAPVMSTRISDSHCNVVFWLHIIHNRW